MEHEFDDATIKLYGLDFLAFGLHGDDYGWEVREPLEKKRILIDTKAYEGKLTVYGVSAGFKGTGHAEWEYILAAMLIYKVIDANRDGSYKADISQMFERDFTMSSGRRFTKEEVEQHISKFFTKVGEDDANVYLRLNVA